MSKKHEHILVVRLSAMGDVAMIIPVLRVFRAQYPEVKISVLTRSFFKPFFRDLSEVDVVSPNLKGEHKGVLGIYKLSRTLNKCGFTTFADLHNVLRTNLLKLFLKDLKFAKLDKGRKEKRALTSGKIFKQLKTTHMRYAEVFQSLGYKLDFSKLNFPEPVNLNSELKGFMGINTQKTIGIAPFAAYKGKVYPLNLMKEVIEQLSKTNKVLLFGGGETETETLNSLERQFQNTTNLSEKITLDEQLDIISNLDVMISMDSGNAHVAAMLGIKVITIWGVTHPYAGFSPFNQPDDYALTPNRNDFPLIPTSVYGNTYPATYESVAGNISVEKVVSKVNEALNEVLT
ncbi:glycosyltransferase family 9 protein [uncultured Algibacter sp.]|uniref:glycosyltransferase family 9 protein n=1 Tax=uncultured Algibacter sp. TaxID=298659 RepID=UPI00262D1299|nr:glycosyltransferase family 9 protein [uncultured Algibacter sp.]